MEAIKQNEKKEICRSVIAYFTRVLNRFPMRTPIHRILLLKDQQNINYSLGNPNNEFVKFRLFHTFIPRNVKAFKLHLHNILTAKAN